MRRRRVSPPLSFVTSDHALPLLLKQNEFASPIYTSLVPDKPEQISKAFAAIYNITATKNITLPFVLSQATSPVLCNTSFVKSMNYTEPISCVQYGYFLMKYLAISANPGWKWGGVGFLIGALGVGLCRVFPPQCLSSSDSPRLAPTSTKASRC